MVDTDATPTEGKAVSAWERAQQKLALTIIMFQIIGPFFYWPLYVALLWWSPFTRGMMVAYGIYMWVDRRAHTVPEGDAPVRRLPFWRHLANYFPVKLIKSADLDPAANYMFCAHPHGVASFSHTANFLTESTGFSRTFPGISLYPLLLDAHFAAPFHREIALRAGFRGASKATITNLLTARPGSSVLLIPGGAAEALKAQPGTYDIILNKRKGFARMALTTGAHLVPVLAFGETSLFEVTQPAPGSFMAKVQKLILKLSGFAFPQLAGEGFWPGAKAVRPLPKALPVTTVVGAPIPVKKWEGPTRDNPAFTAAVDELHARYCAALRAIWDEHKDRLAPRAPAGATGAAALTNGVVCYRRKSLEIVE